MYENREAILEECGDELTKVENTLEVLQANGSWFCFLLMVVLGGIIAVLVVAMYLPIFDLAGNV